MAVVHLGVFHLPFRIKFDNISVTDSVLNDVGWMLQWYTLCNFAPFVSSSLSLLTHHLPTLNQKFPCGHRKCAFGTKATKDQAWRRVENCTRSVRF